MAPGAQCIHGAIFFPVNANELHHKIVETREWSRLGHGFGKQLLLLANEVLGRRESVACLEKASGVSFYGVRRPKCYYPIIPRILQDALIILYTIIPLNPSNGF